jgi:hypothetical protein
MTKNGKFDICVVEELSYMKAATDQPMINRATMTHFCSPLLLILLLPMMLL